MKKQILIYALFVSNLLAGFSKEQCAQNEARYLETAQNYEALNALALQSELPIIRTNGHHAAPYYWQKVLKGKSPVTLVHLDSHSDLGFSREKPDLRTLEHVSSVIVPAIEHGLFDKIHMCMPPWFKRMPLDGQKLEIGTVSFPKHLFVRAKSARVYPAITEESAERLQGFAHPFKVLSQRDFDKAVRKKAQIQFWDCSKDFSELIDLQDQPWVLGIDLDIFATNGHGHDEANPESPLRELDSTISEEEHRAINQRRQHVLSELNNLAQRGIKPLAISISDSTRLNPQTDNWANASGGDFTPACLVHELGEKIERAFVEW